MSVFFSPPSTKQKLLHKESVPCPRLLASKQALGLDSKGPLIKDASTKGKGRARASAAVGHARQAAATIVAAVVRRSSMEPPLSVNSQARGRTERWTQRASFSMVQVRSRSNLVYYSSWELRKRVRESQFLFLGAATHKKGVLNRGGNKTRAALQSGGQHKIHHTNMRTWASKNQSSGERKREQPQQDKLKPSTRRSPLSSLFFRCTPPSLPSLFPAC